MAPARQHPEPDQLVLVLNVGSSSLKACLIDSGGSRLWQGQSDWAPGTGGEGPADALEAWLPEALAPWLERIALVGHRVVHGGERFTAPTPITPALEGALEALVPLAPSTMAPPWQ